MELLVKIDNCFQLVSIFVKGSTLDIKLGSKYAFDNGKTNRSLNYCPFKISKPL